MFPLVFIKKGYHIHHKDGDKSNNDIDNLEMISPAVHVNQHMNDERRNAARERMQTIVRPKADAWHSTKEGLKWHSQHAIAQNFGRPILELIQCSCCGVELLPKVYHEKFCSNKCRSAYRRKSGIDNIEKICRLCGNKFKVNRYAKTKFCSRKCGHNRYKGEKHPKT